MADRRTAEPTPKANIPNMSAIDAVAIARLVCPTFLRKDDCILVKEHFSEATYRAWREKVGSDAAAIENVMNHLHLWDVFSEDGPALVQLAEVLSQSWPAAARTQFPTHEFDVTIAGEDTDYGPTVYLTTRRTGVRVTEGDRDG